MNIILSNMSKHLLHNYLYPPGNCIFLGDSMAHHNGNLFSTKDRDYDVYPDVSCAHLYKGGWWYVKCHKSNLNGLFGSPTYSKGLSWQTWKEYKESMTGVRMMLKKLPET